MDIQDINTQAISQIDEPVNNNTPPIIPNNKPFHFRRIIALILVILLFSGGVYFVLSPKLLQFVRQKEELGSHEPNTLETSPSTVPIITEPVSTVKSPTATPLPSKAPLLSLYFSAVDMSKVDPSGIVVGAKVSLYDGKNHLLGEKTISPVVQEGNIGTGGNVEFNVPLGTYRAQAETDKLIGSLTVTLRSFKDQNHYVIDMKAKSITIKGRYFFDANKNGAYDNGEQVFANKKINAFVSTGTGLKQIYTAGSTTTDNSGSFTISVDYEGSYALGAEQVLGYQELPQRWIDLSSGSSASYDIYLWPL